MNDQSLRYRIIEMHPILLNINYNLGKVFLNLILLSSIISKNHYKLFYLKIIKPKII